MYFFLLQSNILLGLTDFQDIPIYLQKRAKSDFVAFETPCLFYEIIRIATNTITNKLKLIA